MRKIQRSQTAEPVEEIIEYSWNRTGIVRVMIAQGWDVNGVFEPFPAQTYEHREIALEDYKELMAENPSTGKPAGTFRVDDLWPFIERARQGKDALSLRRALGRQNI